MALYSLANVYHTHAKHEAEYNNNFEARLTAAAGPAHDAVLSSQRLAALHTQSSLRQRIVQALYAKAEPLYQRAMVILTGIYGADYPTLKIIRKELALLHQSREARPKLSRVD